MITFRPAPKIVKKFSKVNFEFLSYAASIYFSGIAKINKDYTIRIIMTPSNCSSYTFQTGNIVVIKMSQDIIIEKYFIRDLLHEFRHFLQEKVYRVPDTKEWYDDSTHRSYMNSPCEKDARQFDKKIGSRIIRFYYRMIHQQGNLSYINNYELRILGQNNN